MMDATQLTWMILTSPADDRLVGVPSVYSLVDDTALIHFTNQWIHGSHLPATAGPSVDVVYQKKRMAVPCHDCWVCAVAVVPCRNDGNCDEMNCQ